MSLSAITSAQAGQGAPRLGKAGRMLLEAAAVEALSQTLPDPLKGEVAHRAGDTIAAVIKLLGERPPAPFPPGPWPTPSRAALDLATGLTVFANTFLQPGAMQKAVLDIASRLVVAAYKS